MFRAFSRAAAIEEARETGREAGYKEAMKKRF